MNRGAHGDSSLMLSTSVLSNENRQLANVREEAPTASGGGGCHSTITRICAIRITDHDPHIHYPSARAAEAVRQPHILLVPIPYLFPHAPRFGTIGKKLCMIFAYHTELHYILYRFTRRTGSKPSCSHSY